MTATIVDSGEPDGIGMVLNAVMNSGYTVPGDAGDLGTIDKSLATSALGSVLIKQIDSDGVPVSEWALKNAWIKDFSVPELSYESDDLTTVDIIFKYDWAEYKTHGSDKKHYFKPGTIFRS